MGLMRTLNENGVTVVMVAIIWTLSIDITTAILLSDSPDRL